MAIQPKNDMQVILKKCVMVKDKLDEYSQTAWNETIDLLHFKNINLIFCNTCEKLCGILAKKA